MNDGASTVMQSLQRSVVVKAEAKSEALSLSVDSMLVYGHKVWVVTEITRSKIQAAKMRLIRRMSGLSLRGRLRKQPSWRNSRVEMLVLHIKRSQFR